jgi:hypothetical protein
MAAKKTRSRRTSSRLLWVAIPSHRANTELVALFRNLANRLAAKMKVPHLAGSTSGSPACPLCGNGLAAGKHLQVIHKIGHAQIDIVQKAILAKRQSSTLYGSTTYLVELKHLQNFYEQYHRKHKCVVIGCRSCHDEYDKACKERVSASKKVWWTNLNRLWTTVP